MLESLFNKVSGGACNFIEKGTWYTCFPVNSAKLSGTPFLWNASGRQLLDCCITLLKLKIYQMRNITNVMQGL